MANMVRAAIEMNPGVWDGPAGCAFGAPPIRLGDDGAGELSTRDPVRTMPAEWESSPGRTTFGGVDVPAWMARGEWSL
jgi:hypothetical protein